MDLILKSSTSDYLLADVGVVVKAGTGSTFSNIPPLIRALAQSSGLRARVLAGTTIVNNGSVDLNATDGQMYLNQLWLMSGNDVSPQMSQVEGTISDTQHGARSGGTLHAAAVAGVSDGFITAANQTKLNGIATGATNTPLTATAPVNVTKAAAAVGVGTDAARNDHKHDVTTAAPGATGVSTASAEGSAASLARSDHSHQANTLPVNVTKAAPVTGTSGEPARADHKHDITTAAPSVGIGGSNSEGAATSLARSDHGHALRTTTGPTDLTIGAIANGEYLVRSGTNIIGGSPGGGVFGTYPQYASSDGESTYTGSTAWQTKVTLTTPVLPAGTYRVAFCAEIRNFSSISDDILYRFRQDGATTLCLGNLEVKDTTNYISVSGFAHVTLTAAAHAFTVEYSLENAADSIYIRNARIEIWRVS